MVQKSVSELLAQAVAMEEEAAKDAGALGYMARAMIQATMPHKKQASNEYIRKNGSYTLTMLAPSDVGLPYGTIPRLLLAWISTEAVRTQERTLILGDTLAGFMRELEMVPTGGRWGTITRLRDQMERLFSCSVSCSFSGSGRWAIKNVSIASEVNLWWEPKEPEQAALWQSTLKLSEDFYTEIIAHPVPIDLRALKALRKSPLALDLYFWLTYRMSYLSDSVVIPWRLLADQFGAGYNREDHFKHAMLEALKKVVIVYPAVKVSIEKDGLKIKPSPTHVIR